MPVLAFFSCKDAHVQASRLERVSAELPFLRYVPILQPRRFRMEFCGSKDGPDLHQYRDTASIALIAKR